MFRRMIRRSFTVHQFGLIPPGIIQAMFLGRGWRLAQESSWEPRGQTIGAIAIGATATSPSITKTTSTKITSTILTGVSKTENGSTMPSIAAALRTGTETRLANTVAELDNSQPVQLTAAGVRPVSAVERVLPEEQATEPVAEEPETSAPAIAPVVDSELEAVQAI